MKREQLAWFVFVAVFVLPPTLYFMVNLYWWLFDGNVLIGDKMAAALGMAMAAVFIAGVWADLRGLFKR